MQWCEEGPSTGAEKKRNVAGCIIPAVFHRPEYQDVYELCRNTEDIMGLFSKELQMLDKNSVAA